MIIIPELVRDITRELRERQDKKRKELATGYYPTRMEVIGVTVPELKDLLKTVKPILKNLTPRQRIDLVHALLKTNIFECQQFGYESIIRDIKILQVLTPEDIRQMNVNQDNWVSVDTYSACILGVGWREGKITDQEIQHKIDSADLWQRRQALVATLGWNQKARGGTGDVEKTLWVCKQLVDDHEDMINKALSWALRELSKVDREPVIQFMESNEGRLHNRVKREVWNKLNTGKKNP